MKLFRFELIKLVRNRQIRIAFLLTVVLIVLSALNQVYLFKMLQKPEEQPPNAFRLPAYTQRIFETYGADYSADHALQIEQEYQRILRRDSAYSDESLWEMPGEYGLLACQDSGLIYPLYMQTQYYEELLASRAKQKENIEQLLQNERSLGEQADPYRIRKAELALDAYSVEVTLPNYYADGLSGYINRFLQLDDYSFVGYIQLLFLTLLCGYAFSGEKESGIYPLLFCTARGRMSLYIAKTAACLFVACLLQLLTQGIGLVVFSLRYAGIHGLQASIQTLSLFGYTFADAPYRMSNLDYLMVSVGMQYLYFCIVCTFTIAVSAVCKRSLTAFACGALTGIGNAAFTVQLNNTRNIQAEVWQERFLSVNPANLLWNTPYFQSLNTVRIGDFPIQRIHLLLGVSCGALLLFLAMGCIGYLRVRPARIRRQHGTATQKHQ